MSEKKGLGETVLGWFVVRESGVPEREETADELIKKYAEKEPVAAPPEVVLSGAPRARGGQVDFPALFRAAAIADPEQERIDKARNLLGTLPLQTPREVRKQIVEASLKAFGYPSRRSSRPARRRSRRSRSTFSRASARPSRSCRSRRSASKS